MQTYIAGVDIGTQGCKGALFDEKMQKCQSAFVPLELINPEAGTVWQEPEEIYRACIMVLKELQEKCNTLHGEIGVIGIDGQMAGIMGVDHEGNAVTKYDSWLDSRCNRYVTKMRKQCGTRITEVTGGPLSFNHGPKILWLKYEKPEIYRNVYKFVTISSYVSGRIAGLKGERQYFDFTGLSYSGFGDNLKKQWSQELLKEFDIEEGKMARITSPCDRIGATTEEFSRLTGIKSGVPVAAGCGDTSASIFGTGTMERGVLLDCAGTASVLCSSVSEYKPDTKYQTIIMMRAPEDGIWYPMSYINGGGLCVRWAREQLAKGKENGYEILEREAEQIDAGCKGLLFIPHFSGRVFPYEPRMKGMFAGLDWGHERGTLYRSILEGIACEYAYYLEILREMYPAYTFERLYIMGGGAKSHLLNQIKADILHANAYICREVDTALRGTAQIAAHAVGICRTLKKTEYAEQCYKKDESHTEAYKELTEKYQRLLKYANMFYEQGM